MPFFAGGLYTADDLGNFHLPARAFYAEQLARGEAVRLDARRLLGLLPHRRGPGRHVPSPAPLPLSLSALSRRAGLGIPVQLSADALRACTSCCAAGLRRRDAAMVGSLAFTFSSFNLLHFVHPNAVAAVAHIPWLLAMIDIVMVDAKRWKVALAQAFLALLTGSQILLGCPQYVWFSLLAETGFTLFLVVTRRYLPRDGCETMPTCRVCIGCRRNSSSRVVIAKGIGLLVGAVQLLPTLEALCQSTRNGGDVPEGRDAPPDQPDPARGALPAGRSGVRRQCPRTEPVRGGGAVDAGPVGPRPPQRLGRHEALGPGDGRLCRRGAVVGLGQPGPIRRLAELDPLGRLVPVLLPLHGPVPVRRGRAGGHRLRARRARSAGKAEDPAAPAPSRRAKAGPPRCGGSSRSWARPSWSAWPWPWPG